MCVCECALEISSSSQNPKSMALSGTDTSLSPMSLIRSFLRNQTLLSFNKVLSSKPLMKHVVYNCPMFLNVTEEHNMATFATNTAQSLKIS